ncbi:MAG: AAA family ATPase [Akkermansia sp.]|nr:AAA family ATPase [Akkermansia sp.]
MEFDYYTFSIEEIELLNYRKFAQLNMIFDKSVTALTAPNGGGKSAVLSALAVGCSLFIQQFNVESGIRGFNIADHRLVKQQGGGMTPASGDVEIHCRGTIGHKTIFWQRERSYGEDTRTRISNALELQQAARQFLSKSSAADCDNAAPYPVAPLIAFYDTQRQFNKLRLTQKRKVRRADRFEGYMDCLTSGSYIRIFKDWYKSLTTQVMQESVGSSLHTQLSNQLSIVKHAVNIALEHVGWHNLKWDFIHNDLSLEHENQGTLCYSQLSDGIQSVLSLITDLVHRAVRINPVAPPDLLENISGFVMIDEIDMFLHPDWQQHIIRVYTKIFPKVQFVISTHSPQVLSTLRKEQIRIITTEENGTAQVYQPETNPYAQSASLSLTHIFNVNPVPDVEEKPLIAKLQQLYRNGKFAEGDRLRLELSAHGIDIMESDVDFWKFMAPYSN